MEDLDGDGIEDHYDLDDDGDGFSDLIEIAYPSDPKDPDSHANAVPHGITSNANLAIPENVMSGTKIGHLTALDVDDNETFLFSLLSDEHDSFALDTNGSLFSKYSFNYETDDTNHSITVRVTDKHGYSFDQNFSVLITNELEDKNGDGVEDYMGSDKLSPVDVTVHDGQLTLPENSPPGTIVGRITAVDPDGDQNHNFQILTKPNPENFSSAFFDGLTAWFDASDSSTLSKIENSNQVRSWDNKIDPSVKMYAEVGREPNHEGTINGNPALSFEKNGVVMEKMATYKNGDSPWNPAGVNGKITGSNGNLAIFLVHQSKAKKRSGMPFNFGWGGHFFWSDNRLYWDIRTGSNGNRLNTPLSFDVPFVICMYNSLSEERRGI